MLSIVARTSQSMKTTKSQSSRSTSAMSKRSTRTSTCIVNPSKSGSTWGLSLKRWRYATWFPQVTAASIASCCRSLPTRRSKASNHSSKSPTLSISCTTSKLCVQDLTGTGTSIIHRKPNSVRWAKRATQSTSSTRSRKISDNKTLIRNSSKLSEILRPKATTRLVTPVTHSTAVTLSGREGRATSEHKTLARSYQLWTTLKRVKPHSHSLARAAWKCQHHSNMKIRST